MPEAYRNPSIRELLLPLSQQGSGAALNLVADSAGSWCVGKDQYWLPRIVYRGAGETGEPYIELAIFAGVHGDEPAGVEALIDLLRYMKEQPDLFRAYRIHIYPLCNPTGFEDGTRHSRSGKDLNREFWRGSAEPEVQILERELLAKKFHGIISLHSDDTSDGLYGFVRGHVLTEQLLEPALAAAEAALPVNQAAVIDGFHAVNGIIRTGYEGILGAPPESSPAPFEIVLESPTHAPMDLQRRSFVLE
ncbi:MAG: hypothetical protein EOP84_34325, partial [Verrucomicrobiaceae bacterium]